MLQLHEYFSILFSNHPLSSVAILWIITIHSYFPILSYFCIYRGMISLLLFLLCKAANSSPLFMHSTLKSYRSSFLFVTITSCFIRCKLTNTLAFCFWVRFWLSSLFVHSTLNCYNLPLFSYSILFYFSVYWRPVRYLLPVILLLFFIALLLYCFISFSIPFLLITSPLFRPFYVFFLSVLSSYTCLCC